MGASASFVNVVIFGIFAFSFPHLSLGKGKKIPAGIYKSETSLGDENLIKYMKTMGYKDDIIAKFREGGNVYILLSQLNETYWQINYRGPGGKAVWLTFEYGVQFQGELLDGRKVKQTIAVEDGFVERRIDMGGWESTQESIEGTDEGLQIILKAKEVETAMKFSLFGRTKNFEA